MHAPRTTALLLLLLPLAACDNLDPFNRAGVWRPAGANDANLQAMVDEPNDLVAGRGARGSDGQMAGQAVERLRTDRVRALPASGVSQIVPTGPGGQQGAGGAATAATGF